MLLEFGFEFMADKDRGLSMNIVKKSFIPIAAKEKRADESYLVSCEKRIQLMAGTTDVREKWKFGTTIIFREKWKE